MNRDDALRTIDARTEPWDVIVIGGGATGLGAAVDAASRGYATLLVEQHDFAKGTSSRSTKLIHGGVRYLAQGRLGLVRTALQERDLLLRNAPHLVHDLAFVVPAYSLWELPFYYSGLKAYDLLAGRFSRGSSCLLSRSETLERVATLVPSGLCGGILYHDCQFDDSRLALALARTLFDLGGVAVNYMPVTALVKSSGRVAGLAVRDRESAREREILGRVVINATGVFADRILDMDERRSAKLISPSQGMHVVLDGGFLPGKCAMVVPHTDDRRVLFAIPWQGKTLLGTTDTPVPDAELEPRPIERDLEFLLNHAARYLVAAPGRSDVLSVFAGLRPLVASGSAQRSSAISRDHHIEVSSSGLVTIAGGKWTTYRHMGDAVVDQAAQTAGLPQRPSATRELKLHGWSAAGDSAGELSAYGSDAAAIRGLIQSQPALGEVLHPRLPSLKAEVVWAARQEMARSVEDVLARRTRALFLDARASIEAAPATANLLAPELSQDSSWIQSQISEFTQLAQHYLP